MLPLTVRPASFGDISALDAEMYQLRLRYGQFLTDELRLEAVGTGYWLNPDTSTVWVTETTDVIIHVRVLPKVGEPDICLMARDSESKAQLRLTYHNGVGGRCEISPEMFRLCDDFVRIARGEEIMLNWAVSAAARLYGLACELNQ